MWCCSDEMALSWRKQTRGRHWEVPVSSSGFPSLQNCEKYISAIFKSPRLVYFFIAICLFICFFLSTKVVYSTFVTTDEPAFTHQCHAESTWSWREIRWSSCRNPFCETLPVRVCAKSLQSCLTLCEPKACSPLGCSVYGILQVRILEWIAISFSRESSWLRDWTCISSLSCIGRQVLYH